MLRTAPSHLRFGHFEYFAWSGPGGEDPRPHRLCAALPLPELADGAELLPK